MPISIETHWYDYWPVWLVIIAGIIFAISIYIDNKRISEARAKWHPQFRDGVYEYQEHEDGRRRAIRINSGIGVVDDAWIEMGKDIDLTTNVTS